MPTPILTPDQRSFLAAARTATLATMSGWSAPRLVPICFVVADENDAHGRPLVYTPLDDKPKRHEDPRRLARVQDLLILPEATLLVDHWDEDWTQLGWLRCHGVGELLEPEPRERDEHAAAIAALRAKYPQYAEHRLEERPIIRIALDRAIAWGSLAG
jgi:PPOX class probable F420-dependent enzyme